MQYGVGRKSFLSTDFVLPINKLSIDGTDFTSAQIELSYVDFSSLTFYVKGNHASCSKEVIFNFAAYDSNRDKWDTIPYLSISITPNSTTAVQFHQPLTPDVEKIKLLSIQNQETTSGYTFDVNVSILCKNTFRG